jgi:hypothetical protein
VGHNITFPYVYFNIQTNTLKKILITRSDVQRIDENWLKRVQGKLWLSLLYVGRYGTGIPAGRERGGHNNIHPTIYKVLTQAPTALKVEPKRKIC